MVLASRVSWKATSRSKFHPAVLCVSLFLMIQFLGLGSAAAATTHYIAANGSDSNNGTSKTTPWLHAPGMPNCSGTCASYTPQAGDKFIFRGGDTWHFGNSGLSPYTGGTWDVHSWSGTSAATCMFEGTQTGCIYYGVDQTWFSGASWVRPILTGDNSTSTSYVGSCSYQTGVNNILVEMTTSYTILDNFELTGICTQRTTGDTNAGSDDFIYIANSGIAGTGMAFLENLYIHGWTSTSGAGTGNNTIACSVFGGAGYNSLQTIDHVVIDGADSKPGACGWGVFPSFYHFRDSMVRYITQGVGQWCHDIHDNIFEHIYNPDVPTHGNVLECNSESDGTASGQPANTPNVFYNNIMRHLDPAFAPAGQVGWWFCPNNITDYWYNNLQYDTGGYGDGNMWAIAGTLQYGGCTGTGTQKMFNNTLSGTIQPCYESGSSNNQGGFLTVLNEHLINTPFDGSSSGHTTPCVGANDASNVSQTWAQGNAQGYMSGSAGTADSDTCANESTKPCSPTLASDSTVATGKNEQAYCTTLAGYSTEPAISTDAANACKYGTTDGCAYNTSTHAMVCPAQTSVARPVSTAWDAGAYAYLGQGSSPNPPTGLSALVQ